VIIARTTAKPDAKLINISVSRTWASTSYLNWTDNGRLKNRRNGSSPTRRTRARGAAVNGSQASHDIKQIAMHVRRCRRDKAGLKDDSGNDSGGCCCCWNDAVVVVIRLFHLITSILWRTTWKWQQRRWCHFGWFPPCVISSLRSSLVLTANVIRRIYISLNEDASVCPAVLSIHVAAYLSVCSSVCLDWLVTQEGKMAESLNWIEMLHMTMPCLNQKVKITRPHKVETQNSLLHNNKTLQKVRIWWICCSLQLVSLRRCSRCRFLRQKITQLRHNGL